MWDLEFGVWGLGLGSRGVGLGLRVKGLRFEVIKDSRNIPEVQGNPHGGVRPFHQKSTFRTQLTLGHYAVHIRSRTPTEFGGIETRVLHHVAG